MKKMNDFKVFTVIQASLKAGEELSNIPTQEDLDNAKKLREEYHKARGE